jgi:hypothetical protein
MKELTIGKLPDNHIVIENRMVSRHHAKILLDRGGRFEIIDLESKNGTFVNGRRVRGSQSIRPGDRIMVANTNLPNDWVRYFDQIPDDEPERVVESQPAPSMLDPELLSSVLYDFDKEVDAVFAGQTERLRQIITDFKQNRLPGDRQISVRNYSEEMLDLLIERYDFVGKQLSLLLNRLALESSAFQTEYDSDMQKLDVTYQYYMRNSKGEADLAANLKKVDARKDEMKSHYEALRKEVLPVLDSLVEDYYTNNPPPFTERLELTPADSPIWKDLNYPNYEIQKTFYLGEEVLHFTILQKPVELKRRVYVQSLYGGNLLFKYSKKNRQSCFDAVNALICRMLAATESGKMKVVMVDFGEMEGTCSEFQGLNKAVYKMISRNDEFTKELTTEASYTENVIQNLLQGEVTDIAEYNRTKTEKVPYTLLVLKDISAGCGEFGEKLVKVMRNGSRAGVFVLLLLDEIDARSSEESLKVLHQIQKVLKVVPIKTRNFAMPLQENANSDSSQIIRSESFSSPIISSIIRRVNQGLEMRSETILKFNEYRLSKKDWWSGQSAKRIDLPFGLTKEMKTAAFQITQESGQNSAVVIGIPGSGKSVFLHTIIASAITHYSPKELQLYLLDFSGVEFNVYANHKLPHARVIAPEAEREFGLSILREVYQEGNRRMALCRDNGVTNIVELKQQNPELVVPRLLVIIDEFQKIFEVDNDSISKDANAKIHAIIQEYRKFGINLILATQKLPFDGVVPYDLIANRVVFKSDPRDFEKLIKWPFSTPLPRLLTGYCVYNNESGAEFANRVVHSFFINASKELETLLAEVSEFAKTHPEMMDNHRLRAFRSDELPEFTERVVKRSHFAPQEAPSEVGVYLGESIAISDYHVYVPLTRDSKNNILIIGGAPGLSKCIAYHTMMSEIAAHTEKSCNVILMNFMTKDDPMRDLFHSDLYAAAYEYSNIEEAKSEEEVKDYLQFVKNVIDKRKNDASMPMIHFFINIFEFQRGRMFDGTGSHGDSQSECTHLLEYIMRNGPLVGVFTVLQVDNLDNLKKISYDAQNMFCHRIALQMSERDSDKIVGNSAANKLRVLNRSKKANCRALYYNNVNNAIDKFKPYNHELLENQLN